ncbi:MAG: KamA family radical SAM protein [Lentisphaeria bacterium]|nr:KamA family radical SAM protein [Lentisphaeria bacterium]
MNPTQYREAHGTLLRILDIAPAIRDALLLPGPLPQRREALERVLVASLLRTGREAAPLEPLEWVLVKESVHVLLDLVHPRNEARVGFGFFHYLALLARGDADESETSEPAPPSAGFLAEIEHLLRAIVGRSGIYDREPVLVTDETEGVSVAQRRSDYLCTLAARAHVHADRVPCGLHSALARRRSRNRQRIMNVYGITDVEWNDWRWHVRHAIRDADTLARLVELTPAEREAIELARKNHVPFAVTPYYASLMEARAGGEPDRAIRAQVIPSLGYVTAVREERAAGDGCMDFMLERDTSPLPGVTRRYPMICILKPVLTCPQICVYCQRNWQITDVCAGNATAPWPQMEAAIDWIAERPAIREVLVTGGDPFILSDRRLRAILSRLSRIAHVNRIRIGTRTPVTLPQRITETLVRMIAQYHIPGRREVLVVTHFEHPTEITPAAMEAVQRIRRQGMGVYNQLVYTFHVSRRFEACALRQHLRSIGVTPYYTFNTKGKEETADFRVPIARLLQEQKEENRLFPGSVRTDEVVFNVPRLGKNYLRAGQHHDLIGILPNGCRVYEFHPWEKKLAKADTYVYTDVSIHDYLQRLAAAGEDPADYGTIWYYY